MKYLNQLQRGKYSLLILTISVFMFVSSCRTIAKKKDNQSTQPNIVFILSDDLGWAELGCYGNSFNETPAIDKLAKEGILFTQAYAAAPVCSPYRASLLTGQYPARVGILDYLRPNDDAPLSTEHVSLAKILKRNGYATGMVGKWHLTGYEFHGAKNEIRATDHGFDEELVSEIKGVGNGANFFPYVFHNQSISWLNVKEKKLPGNEYLTDRMNFEAVEFIERNKDRPFFLYLSHFSTHSILNGKPELVEKYRKKHTPGKSTTEKCYLCQDQGLKGDPGNHWAGAYNPHLAAMLESIDDGVGLIMDKLEELGLSENTIVVFTSDNGGEAPNVTSNAPLRGGKSQLYEGGIREPLIIRWPKKIPANTKSSQFTANVDFYPTFLNATGISPDHKQKLDGISILPVLENSEMKIERDPFYWHYPLEKPHFLGGTSSGAIRKGNWKLIEFFVDKRLELYNLAEDIGEINDLSKEHPEIVKELYVQLAQWRKDVKAEIPKDQNYAFQ
ncbi:MAG: sulfatase [Bacteroidetes bacterium]|nr:sulfatase [Bacteroidota bacterium]